MATQEPKYLTGDPAAVNAFLDKFDTFLFDCDGVLWAGDHTYPNTREVLELLRARGKRLVFVTNNSTKSRAAYAKKFESLSIPATPEEIFGSAYSAAVYIARILPSTGQLKDPAKRKVFVLGMSGIEEELAAEGVPYCGGTDPALMKPWDNSADPKLISSGELLDDEVGVVLTGLDFNVNYRKMSTALAYLQRGAVFLATNIDSTLPAGGGFFPGAGSCGAGVAKAIGRDAMSLGKPSQAMMDAIEGKFQVDRARTCMVGDRLNTDIAFGIRGSLGGTLHVLSGVSQKHEWGTDGVMPAYYADTLGDLMIAGEAS